MSENKTQKKSAIFYEEWKMLIEHYPIEDKLAIYEIFSGARDIETISNPYILGVAEFILMKKGENEEKYEDLKEKRKAAAKARWDKSKKPTEKSTETTQKSENEQKATKGNTTSFKTLEDALSFTENDGEDLKFKVGELNVTKSCDVTDDGVNIICRIESGTVKPIEYARLLLIASNKEENEQYKKFKEELFKTAKTTDRIMLRGNEYFIKDGEVRRFFQGNDYETYKEEALKVLTELYFEAKG